MKTIHYNKEAKVKLIFTKTWGYGVFYFDKTLNRWHSNEASSFDLDKKKKEYNLLTLERSIKK